MTMWTTHILPKNGHYVQSVSLEISDPHIGNPQEKSRDIFFDNTILCPSDEGLDKILKQGHSESLSRESAANVPRQCLHIRSLKLGFQPGCSSDFLGKHKPTSTTFPIPILSGLQNLRSLELKSMWSWQLPNLYLIAIIQSLPGLECFSCAIVTKDPATEENRSLGYHLAKLENLSSLSLENMNTVDGSWCHHRWPKKLKTIRLISCQYLPMNEAHKLLHTFAPKAVKMEIRAFSKSRKSTVTPVKKSNGNNLTEVDFPELEELTLTHVSGLDILSAFKESKNLRVITYLQLPHQSWSTVQTQVQHRCWSKLKSINLWDIPKQETSLDSELKTARKALQNACKVAKIKLSIKVQKTESS